MLTSSLFLISLSVDFHKTLVSNGTLDKDRFWGHRAVQNKLYELHSGIDECILIHTITAFM